MPIINLTDGVNTQDSIEASQSHGFRTEIIGGYDAVTDEYGKTTFGTTLFKERNMTLIGGSVFILEKLFNMRYTTANNDSTTLQVPPTVAQLFQSAGQSHIGYDYYNFVSNSGNFSDTFDATGVRPSDEAVCMFAIGRNGAGTSLTDVRDVSYTECGQNTVGVGVDFIPIRAVTNESDIGDAAAHNKYWIRSVDNTSGKTYYFGKTFDSMNIYTRRRDASKEGEGSLVQLATAYTENNTVPIETYIELKFSVSSDELNEYFDITNSSVEDKRVNSIFLLTGKKRARTNAVKYTVDAAEHSITHEYDNVRVYSKLNFPNEVLQMDKTLTIIYRIFTA